MGKGKRNREKRERTVGSEVLVDRLLDTEDLDAFLRLIDENPELLGGEVHAQLERMTAQARGLVFRPWQRLLSAARRDPAEAWEVFSDEISRYTEVGEKLGVVIEEALTAEQDHHPERAIELAEKARGHSAS